MNKSFTLAHLAEHLNAELVGKTDLLVDSIAPLKTARAGQLSFLSNPVYKKFVCESQASAIITHVDEPLTDHPGAKLLVKNPLLGFAQCAQLFSRQEVHQSGTHPSAEVDPTANIHPSAIIGPLVTVGKNVTLGEGVILHAGSCLSDQVTIGKGTLIYPNVVIYHKVSIGEGVIIHAGAVIGSDGFGYANDQGRWVKIPQLGSVEIGNNCEIGANTTIDRGALDNTVLNEGVIVDNQVQIAHNVVIGKHTAIAGCVGIAGSTEIGECCMIGGGSAISGHLKIASNVIITGNGMVTKSILKQGVYSSGTSLQTNADWRRSVARFRNLDNLAKKVMKIEKQINE